MPTGLGDEQLWISATNDNTGASTALNDLSASSRTQYSGSGVTVAADTSEGGTYALSFNGTSTRSWLYTPSLQTNGGYFGWSVWFKADAFNSNMTIAGGNAYTSHNGGLLYVNSSGNLILSLLKGTNGVPNVVITHAGPLNAGQWYHAAATGDGTTARLYLDGVEVGSGAFTGFPTSWQRFMRLGSSGAGAADSGYGTDALFFDGLIDDARFYDRTLTQTDITHLSSSRGVIGPSYSGLGDEKLWLSPTNNNTGTSTAFQDQSGNGNNGTASGTLVVADTSEGGSYAFDFDGANDYISNSSLSLAGLTEFSYSGWVYDSSASGHRAIFSHGENADYNNDIYILNNNGAFNAEVNNGAAGNGNSSLYAKNNWNHLAVVFDGSGATLADRLRYFLNGTEVTLTYTYNVPTSTSSVTPAHIEIGSFATYGGGLHFWQGKMDDIRVYTRTLTQAEITHLAEARGIEGPPPVGLGDEQLWLCPSLNDSAADISGNGNDGTYQGGMGTVADTSNGGSLAYDFDGTDDRIAFGDTLDSVWTSGSWTISQWIYPEDATYNWYLSKYEGGSKSQFITNARNAGNGLRAGAVIYGNASGSIVRGFEGTTNLSLNQWYHMVIEYDNSQPSDNQVRVWLDGVEETINIWASSGTVSNIQDTAAELRIDGLIDGNATFFKPSRNDDIRAYDRALTQAEITHLASKRGVEGPPTFTGLGDEQLWLCPSLDDSANDISGYGNDGTYVGGMGTVADTSNGGSRCYDFDGTNDCIQLPAGVVSTSGPLVISLWVEHETTGNASRAYVSDWDHAAAKRSVLFGSNAGNHLAYFSNNGGSVTQQITGSATSTVWTHVLISQSNTGDIEFYKDGVLDDTGGPYLGRFNSGSPWLVGAIGTAASPSWTFNGKMDDIRAYNRTLTQSEITHLATSRGIEGSPSGPPAQYNAFLTHAFKQLFQTRLR